MLFHPLEFGTDSSQGMLAGHASGSAIGHGGGGVESAHETIVAADAHHVSDVGAGQGWVKCYECRGRGYVRELAR